MILNSACLHICVYTLHIIISRNDIQHHSLPSLPPSQLSFLIILIKQPPELQWKISNNLTSLAALLKSFSPVSCSETVKILPSWAQWWSLIIVTTAISVISSEQGAECGLNGAMHNYLLSRNFTSHKANRPLYPLSTPQTPSPPIPPPPTCQQSQDHLDIL